MGGMGRNLDPGIRNGKKGLTAGTRQGWVQGGEEEKAVFVIPHLLLLRIRMSAWLWRESLGTQSCLHECPVAAITNDRKPGGSKQRKVLLLRFGGQKPEISLTGLKSES